MLWLPCPTNMNQMLIFTFLSPYFLMQIIINIISSRGQRTLMLPCHTAESFFPGKRAKRAGQSFSLLLKGMHVNDLDLWWPPWRHEEKAYKMRGTGQHIMKLPNKKHCYLSFQDPCPVRIISSFFRLVSIPWSSCSLLLLKCHCKPKDHITKMWSRDRDVFLTAKDAQISKRCTDKDKVHDTWAQPLLECLSSGGLTWQPIQLLPHSTLATWFFSTLICIKNKIWHQLFIDFLSGLFMRPETSLCLLL